MLRIVLDEHDDLGAWEVDIGQILQNVGIIDGGVAVRHFDVAPTSSGANSMNTLDVPLRSYS